MRIARGDAGVPGTSTCYHLARAEAHFAIVDAGGGRHPTAAGG